MEHFLEYLRKEWSVISQTPFTFIILICLAFGIAWVIIRWAYTTIINQKDATIESLNERLHLKSEQSESIYPMKLLVIAKPNAKEEKVEKVDATTLRVSVKALPKAGRANEAISQLLAKHFNIPLSQVHLLSGFSSKYKYFVIEK